MAEQPTLKVPEAAKPLGFFLIQEVRKVHEVEWYMEGRSPAAEAAKLNAAISSLPAEAKSRAGVLHQEDMQRFNREQADYISGHHK